MGLITALLEKKEKRSGTSNPAQWFIDWVTGGSATSSGAKVNENSALKYTPFWAAVRIISGTVAELPFKVYRRISDGKKKEPNHAVQNLLNIRPNDYIDSITLKEVLQSHVLTYGNGFAEIQRDGAGRPIALWPLLPDRTERKLSKSSVPYYEVRSQAGETVELPDYNVLHIKGLGFDGYSGYNVVAYHKEAIGYGVAVKEYGARFFGNEANPGGVLEHPQALSDKAKKSLIEQWETMHGGLSNSHRLSVLEEGMKWHAVGIEPEKAQALEVQKYTVDDCSRIFNIPPHKIGSMDRATFNNIEELNIDFVSQTMLYWFKKWESECNYKLFMPKEYGKLYCEILVEGLLRGKTISRYQAYNIGRNAGFLCVDDIREMENMNPLPDGKGQIFLEPLNMKEAGTEPPEPKPVPNEEEVKSAHRENIDLQWQRVLRNFINVKNIDYQKQRERALDIMYGPLYAFASLRGIGQVEIKEILEQFLEQNLTENQRYKLKDSESLTDRLMERIGENHI